MILYNFKPMQKFIVTDVLSSLKYSIGTYGLICNVDPSYSEINASLSVLVIGNADELMNKPFFSALKVPNIICKSFIEHGLYNKCDDSIHSEDLKINSLLDIPDIDFLFFMLAKIRHIEKSINLNSMYRGHLINHPRLKKLLRVYNDAGSLNNATLKLLYKPLKEKKYLIEELLRMSSFISKDMELREEECMTLSLKNRIDFCKRTAMSLADAALLKELNEISLKKFMSTKEPPKDMENAYAGIRNKDNSNWFWRN